MDSSNLIFPPEYSSFNNIEKQQVTQYLLQLNETEVKAYLIAIDHLKTSFNILKSNGYLNWKKSHN